MAVGPAVADAEHEVATPAWWRCRSGGWSAGRHMPAISGWSSGIAPQPISVGITGMPVISANSTSRSRRIGVDDAAAGDDQRPLGLVQHRQRLLDLRARWPPACRPAAARRCRCRTRSRPSARRTAGRSAPGPGRPERIRWNACWNDARHLRRLEHRDRPLGHRLGDGLDVDRLEVLLVQPRARRLAGDAEDRDASRPRPSRGR